MSTASNPLPSFNPTPVALPVSSSARISERAHSLFTQFFLQGRFPTTSTTGQWSGIFERSKLDAWLGSKTEVILYSLVGVEYDRLFLGGFSERFAPQHVR
ncbi:hypothetical protein AVDCRST_MAG84-5498 [uncultured Microcoleus sp.]|uniref:Uncharacterized protein n=1 Tax=uncultured Microcoleus sp. TaxID=259945 RepID=A0A6J4NJS9_9CYAN|nr:hypothetical protein AVDCRST_MAG84-5498 [uncultured Microcoleus sp.]